MPCAAVFTQNKFAAPPVELDRATLKANGGGGGGDRQFGQRQCRHRRAGLQERPADGRGDWRSAAGCERRDVLVCSTGIIGTPLPMEPILAATPRLAKKLSVDGAHDAARGILTTDHQAKEVVIKGSTFTLGGMAKGCGMIAPNMATMLAFLTTDADVSLAVMQKALEGASDATFNTLNVDGATSTNDTAMLLAIGQARQGRPRRVRQRGARRLPRADDEDGARCGGHDADRAC